jgi:iron complex outermembrane receptor protein
MFRHTKTCAAVLLALGGSSFLYPAFGQQQLQRVEITGSNLKRSVSSEEALPVTIINVEQLRSPASRASSRSCRCSRPASRAMSVPTPSERAPAVRPTPTWRGIGTNKTLVLLNGRRVAAFAFNVNAVDLNAIPFAVVERVEVLRDGASAIYGTDAIGGVINFITKREFKGVSVSAEATKPQHTGGQSDRTNILFRLRQPRCRGRQSVGDLRQFTPEARPRDRPRLLPHRHHSEQGRERQFSDDLPGNFTQSSTGVAANLTRPTARRRCRSPARRLRHLRVRLLGDHRRRSDVKQQTLAGQRILQGDEGLDSLGRGRVH